MNTTYYQDEDGRIKSGALEVDPRPGIFSAVLWYAAEVLDSADRSMLKVNDASCVGREQASHVFGTADDGTGKVIHPCWILASVLNGKVLPPCNFNPRDIFCGVFPIFTGMPALQWSWLESCMATEGACLQPFNPQTTHLVVGELNTPLEGFVRQYYLDQVVIVNTDWAEDSLRHGRLLSVWDYEVNRHPFADTPAASQVSFEDRDDHVDDPQDPLEDADGDVDMETESMSEDKQLANNVNPTSRSPKPMEVDDGSSRISSLSPSPETAESFNPGATKPSNSMSRKMSAARVSSTPRPALARERRASIVVAQYTWTRTTTGSTLTDDQVLAFKQLPLPAPEVDEGARFRYLVAPEFKRTRRIITAIAAGAQLLSEQWIRDSLDADEVQEPSTYHLLHPVHDVSAVIQRARMHAGQLFAGMTFIPVGKTKQSKAREEAVEHLKIIVTSNGGKLLTRVPKDAAKRGHNLVLLLGTYQVAPGLKIWTANSVYESAWLQELHLEEV